MQTISYHSFHDKYRNTIFACDREATFLPLIVNCAGATVAKWPFKTVNSLGRKDYYFLYLKKGILDITINNTSQAIGAGTLVIMPPNSPYEYRHFEERELMYYWVHFTGSAVTDIFRSVNVERLPIVLSIPQASTAVDYQMSKMFDVYIKKGDYRDNELSHCLDAMLIELAKKSGTSAQTQGRLSKSIKFINNNYTTEISVPKLAEMEALSVSRYIALFNEVMHTSPYQYIIELRLSAACEMLANSNLSITGISELLGFQSIFFFSKLFKKHIGVSPMQYKKNIIS